ncbi:MAG TPA: Ig-like domain-containing protein [Gemmatimonadales bacterium]|nr:Ig-like domain-containing protein [Gemmatimonadales bacterium]
MELRKSVTKLVQDSPRHIHSAGKWTVLLLTTIAALIGILVNARSLGLTPWLGVAGAGFANLAARRVVIAPAQDTLTAVGDTLQLAATVTDEHGATISGASVVWASDDSAVATVDSSGAVAARGPGAATITAAVHDHVGRASVTVQQRVRSVAIARDSVVRLPEGGAVQLLARALDARGRLVAGRTVRWESDDSSVVAITSSGSASARTPGRTTLTASIEGASASIAAEVSLAAASVRLLSGDDQRAGAGRRLPQAVTVLVLSHGGRPVPGAAVSFATGDAQGKADPETSATDRDGRAHATWSLGPQAGRQHLTATVVGLDTSVVLTAEADPLPTNTRVQLAGDAPQGTAGATLASPVTIRITDSSGAAVADVPVAWTAASGSIEALSPRTDSLGQASARWTLGRRAGPQRARAQVGNPRTMPPFTITATALAGPAATVAVESGADQSGPVGAALRRPIVVRLTDSAGNVAAGATLRAAPASGSVADTLVVADQAGRASLVWTLGHQAGPQRLDLRAGDGAPVRVGANARPLEPANIAPGAAPRSAPAGRALPKPVPFVVTDAYGNAIPDVQVVFTATSGSVAPVRVMTDAGGQAATRWTLGSRIGEDTLTATVRGTPVTGSVAVRAAKRTTGR